VSLTFKVIFTPLSQLLTIKHIANPTMFSKVNWVCLSIFKNKKLPENTSTNNGQKLAKTHKKGA
jgi:hypothetical protein